MAWVAFDRTVRMAERAQTGDAALERWKATRDQIHAEVCLAGYDPERNTFTQYYGSDALDASLLLIPAMGFLPPDDGRVIGTVDAVQRELTHDGLLMRYSTDTSGDGLPGGEGAFLPCSFWLADALAMIGRMDEARALFAHLLTLRSDLGLISEEYDTAQQRLIGNFPQAFTHLTLIKTAALLDALSQPGANRRQLAA
jgi:GH15 family glucan-1,4-alpha-glucosidase